MKAVSNMPGHYVASGRYVISQKTPSTLEAFLGTCVGVTLCDREAEVGGLAHFLLPEHIRNGF